MLNLKKGLALVLAAATAFTFAPVANLGSAVDANAAGVVKLKDSSQTAGSDATVNLEKVPAGTYVLTSSEPTALGSKVTLTFGDGASTGALTFTDGRSNAFVVSANDDLGKNDKTGASIWGEADVKAKIEKSGAEWKNNGNVTFTLVKVGTTGENTTVSSGASGTDNKGIDLDHSISFTFSISGVDLISVKQSGSVLDHSTKLDNSTKYTDLAYGAYSDVTFVLDDTKKAPFTAAPGAVTDTNSDGVADDTSLYHFEYASKNNYVTFSSVTGKKGTSAGTVRITGKIAGDDVVTVKAVADKNIGVSGTEDNASPVVKKGQTFASKDYNFTVGQDTANITRFTWTENGKTAYLAGTPKPVDIKDDDLVSVSGSSQTTINTLIKKSVKLNVTAYGQLTFTSLNPAIATVSSDGTVTAVAPGSANIQVLATAAGGKTFQQTYITVIVSQIATDEISAKVDGNDVNDSDKPLNMDLSTSTASNAVKTARIDAVSAAGLPVVYTLLDSNKSAVLANSSNIASVDQNGNVTAGNTAGTVYVRLQTGNKGAITGTTKDVKVVVNELPAAVITQDNIKLNLTDKKSVKIAPTSNVAGAVFSFSLNSDDTDVVALSGDTVTAKRLGEARVTIATPATKTTRYTEKEIKVDVVENVAKAVSDLKVASSALTVKVGDTASAGASTTASGAAITYTSSDTDVATVAADGTITAVAPGTAVVTVKAAETDKVNAGTATIVVTVPSNPQKVTGVKVSNKKGAYVSVKWTSQGGNVNYRVYKKVGKGKWVGKNVAGSKTTLKVKKGAKVQVKVKSYVKDASGKTTWGPAATKAKTFKTDKK